MAKLARAAFYSTECGTHVQMLEADGKPVMLEAVLLLLNGLGQE